MSKDEFRQELEKHDLNVASFLDLRDIWDSLSHSDKLELCLTGYPLEEMKGRVKE